MHHTSELPSAPPRLTWLLTCLMLIMRAPLPLITPLAALPPTVASKRMVAVWPSPSLPYWKLKTNSWGWRGVGSGGVWQRAGQELWEAHALFLQLALCGGAGSH